MTKVDIISGFLGAGKTTLIKQLLKDVSKSEKIVIIENEIGEENIDAKDLQELKASVREITSGCICCSLSMNLITVLNELGEEGSVDRIIIEPTGLATLSDLLGIFSYINKNTIKLNLIITILDILELELFAGNFGTFFSDQIRNCRILILSKLDKATSSDLEFAKYYASNLNPNAPILVQDWTKINISCLENLLQNKKEVHHIIRSDYERTHSYDGYDNLTVKPKKRYSKKEIISLLKEVQLKNYGEVIRIKGFLSLEDSTSMKIDYVLGQIYTKEKKNPSESVLTIIGKELKIHELKNILK